MKMRALLGFSALLLTAWAITAIAEVDSGQVHEKKVVVAVKTDDVELHEVDVSHLQPGDSETIFTENGKTIDILRTEDDVEMPPSMPREGMPVEPMVKTARFTWSVKESRLTVTIGMTATKWGGYPKTETW